MLMVGGQTYYVTQGGEKDRTNTYAHAHADSFSLNHSSPRRSILIAAGVRPDRAHAM